MKKLKFGERTLIMGILNVTPDSFYDGGRYARLDEALRHAEQMVKEGADIIDIGGESTRPGAEPVPLQEELDRVLPVVEKVAANFDVHISIDTYKSKVAEEAIKLGADIVNDISGLGFDPQMPEIVSKYGTYIVIMHIKGTPKDMQRNPHYEDVLSEVGDYFTERIRLAELRGIQRDKVILDPGIGFGKLLEHNLELIANIDHFKKRFGLPLLVGASRKSFIGMVLDGIPPNERLEGTLAVTAFCALHGVDILRVHDVKENLRVVRMIEAVKRWRRSS